jgi:hypothetical protein
MIESFGLSEFCFRAAFTNELMMTLAEQPEIYSIEQ